MTLSVVVLAAGLGKRMYSALPKVLHPLGGLPMLSYVLKNAKALNPDKLVIVVGKNAQTIQKQFDREKNIDWVSQAKPLGSGHALKMALKKLPPTGHVLVLYGDVPCISLKTLQALVKKAKKVNGVALLTDEPLNPFGMGRIVRSLTGKIAYIVEESDATPAQRSIKETYAGIMVLPILPTKKWLSTLTAHNEQEEYYLTDIIQQIDQDKFPVLTYEVNPSWQAMGVNTRRDLACLERLFQRNNATVLLEKGVSILDPERFDLRGEVKCGSDVLIDINCVIEGQVILGNNVTIGANCVLRDTIVQDNAVIKPFCHIEGAVIGRFATVGPYARIRKGTQIKQGAHVGNFVEIKNTQLGAYSKANHFGYLGDGLIGENVNIGAGTVTCNYDGEHKFSTTIQKEAFIGSGTMLVAPVTIGEHAVIGAGSVITQDAPAKKLTLARSSQLTVKAWKKSFKKST